MNERRSPRFYFALPRLIAKLHGSDPRRVEKNGAEAWVGNFAIFAISYLYFAALIPSTGRWWLQGLFLIALAFLVCLFWLFALYINWLILKLLHRIGFLRSLPLRRGQGVLHGIAATAMAFALLQRGSVGAELAAIWLTATAMNLLAALILALGNGDTAS